MTTLSSCAALLDSAMREPACRATASGLTFENAVACRERLIISILFGRGSFRAAKLERSPTAGEDNAPCQHAHSCSYEEKWLFRCVDCYGSISWLQGSIPERYQHTSSHWASDVSWLLALLGSSWIQMMSHVRKQCFVSWICIMWHLRLSEIPSLRKEGSSVLRRRQGIALSSQNSPWRPCMDYGWGWLDDETLLMLPNLRFICDVEAKSETKSKLLIFCGGRDGRS